MGITIFKVFIWGGISPDIRSEITFLPLPSRVAVKLNFRRYTSPNENFEYSYPLIDALKHGQGLFFIHIIKEISQIVKNSHKFLLIRAQLVHAFSIFKIG